jgi:outer membrane lipase/esterase
MKPIRSLYFLAGLAAGVPTVAAQNRTFANQYSFGDSLSDSGNLLAATSAIGAPNPPAPYFQGRFSNGRVWTELLGGNAALAATAAPTARGSMNFAFGGATAGGSSQLPPSLGVQVGLFRQRGITPGANDLFTVLAGANDLISVLGAPTTPANPAALDGAGAGAAQAVAANVQALVGFGARNLVVAGLPNLGATPRSLAAGGPGGAGATFGLRASNAFNQELRARLQPIAAASADVNLIYLDLQGVLDRVVADYRVLGFTNASQPYLPVGGAPAGTGDPNNYVFWDDIHPTARTHAILAAIVTEQLNPEGPLGFAGTLGSAALALQGLGAAALDDRLGQLAFSGRTTGRADVYASFNYGSGGRDADAARPDFDYEAQVVTAGVDRRFSDGVFAGAAFNLGRMNADVGAGAGDFTIEDAGARVYAVYARRWPAPGLLRADRKPPALSRCQVGHHRLVPARLAAFPEEEQPPEPPARLHRRGRPAGRRPLGLWHGLGAVRPGHHRGRDPAVPEDRSSWRFP